MTSDHCKNFKIPNYNGTDRHQGQMQGKIQLTTIISILSCYSNNLRALLMLWHLEENVAMQYQNYVSESEIFLIYKKLKHIELKFVYIGNTFV